MDTPEPVIGRPRLNAVSFKDDKALPMADGSATATFTVGQPQKASITTSPQWQQASQSVDAIMVHCDVFQATLLP